MTIEIDEAVRNAAATGNATALKELMALHGSLLVRLDDDPAEFTSLHLTSASGNVEAVRFLLAVPVQADPCAARKNNFTPLHAAAMQGHATICEILIGAGQMRTSKQIRRDMLRFTVQHSPGMSMPFGYYLQMERIEHLRTTATNSQRTPHSAPGRRKRFVCSILKAERKHASCGSRVS